MSLYQRHDMVGGRINRTACTHSLTEVSLAQDLLQLCFYPVEELDHPDPQPFIFTHQRITEQNTGNAGIAFREAE